ncbi:MAG: hypothetical protein ACRCTG_16600 [Aestuariivirga sp.]
MRNGKSIRDLIKESKLQDLRAAGMAEAEAQRAQSVRDMVKEGGVTGEPASGPIDTSTPKVEAPEAATPSAVRTGAVEAQSLPALAPGVGASSEGAAGEAEALANMKAPPSVSTPAPMDPRAAAAKAAQPGGTYTPRWEGDTGPDKPAGAAPAKVVQPTPQQGVAATGVVPVVKKPSGKFTVNGESYDTREQAQAAAERSAPSTMDLFMKNTVPKLAAQYVINGEPEKAKAWTDYSESEKGKRAIKDWSAAYTAPDFDTAAARFGKYYTEHINDGVDYTGHKLLTKQDGTQVAVVTLKDKASGKTMEMEMTRERMLAMGAANNPQKLFETEQARQASAEKLKYEAALKVQERAQKKQDDIELEGVKAKTQRELKVYEQDRLDQREGLKTKGEMDKLGLKFELDAEFEQKYKKATSPTERRALVFDGLTKSDPRFSRLTKEEQSKRVDDAMSVIEKDDKPAAQPGVASKPIGYDPKYKVVYQRGTGKPFHVVDGQYVPIEGAVPPQANGLPKK